jgi:hypothetical protein
MKRATTIKEVQIAMVMTAEAMPIVFGESRLKNSMPRLSGQAAKLGLGTI